MCAKGRCSCKGYTEELFVAQCLHQVSDSMYPAWYYNNDDDDNNNNNNNNNYNNNNNNNNTVAGGKGF